MNMDSRVCIPVALTFERHLKTELFFEHVAVTCTQLSL